MGGNVLLAGVLLPVLLSSLLLVLLLSIRVLLSQLLVYWRRQSC